MTNPRIARLEADVERGRLSRRQVLEAGLKLGLATPVIVSLMSKAPQAVAAPQSGAQRFPSANQDGGSGTFTAIIGSSADDVDPHSTYSTIGSMICFPSYEMLIQYKGGSVDEFDPMLATSWEVNAEQTQATFKLAEGVTFHDGSVCDATAVKTSFTRLVKMALGPFEVFARFVPDPDTQIVVVDATTVQFNFATAQPLFLAAMASSYGPMIVSPTAVEENKTDDDPWAHEFFVYNAVGTGPYKLVQNDLNEGAKYEKFEEYHGGWDGNHFDSVIYRVVPETSTRRQLIESGEADATAFNLTPEDVQALGSDANVQVVTYPTTRIQWVIMNAPKLLTPAVRQGFSYAFPYDDANTGAYGGLLKRSGPIPDSIIGSDPDVFLYQTDLTKAKELILSGGFSEGDTFDYYVASDDQVENTVAQLFQANVQSMGFNLEINSVDSATIEGIVFGDSPADERPMFVGGWEWWPDYNDSYNMLAPCFTIAAAGGGGNNGGYYENARVEEIIAEARDVTDTTRLVELMKEAQNILTEQDPPVIYLGQVTMYTVLGKAIQGFVANPLYLETYLPYLLSRTA
ncbi:glutathione ABC transporter substrate-binding protein [soil metagenome]